MNDNHRGYRYEFLDLDSDANEEPGLETRAPLASDRGAGALAFAGTARKEAAEAAGLAMLAGDEFGGGPSVPMVPGTWKPNGFDNENHIQ
jgi:PPE-repeat protein